MKKTYTVTITLTYDGVTDTNELKQAVLDEASSWVESGSFGDELYCTVGNGDLISDKVTIKEKR